ncbi:MAG TPA: hypothetical protein VF311_08975 [Terriglobales bacterium]
MSTDNLAGDRLVLTGEQKAQTYDKGCYHSLTGNMIHEGQAICLASA